MNKIQLHSLATPNGQKVSIALEELGLAYDSHTINIMKDDQFTPEFIALNPNSKIPAILDPNGPGNTEHAVMESGAILLYLAEKTGKLISHDPVKRSETIQWLFFQMASIGPMFGQFGHFYKYAGEKCDHPYPVTRYTNEAKRLLKVLDKRLVNRDYIVDEYSIADIAIFPWVLCLDKFYSASEHLSLSEFKNVNRWLQVCLDKPATQAGLNVCPFN